MKRRCAWCGTGFEWEGVGRPPTYCRRSHRQRAFEARREANRLGIGGVLIDDEAWRRFLDAVYVLESGLADAGSDLDEGDPASAARGLVDAAHTLLDTVPEPIAAAGEAS